MHYGSVIYFLYNFWAPIWHHPVLHNKKNNGYSGQFGKIPVIFCSRASFFVKEKWKMWTSTIANYKLCNSVCGESSKNIDHFVNYFFQGQELTFKLYLDVYFFPIRLIISQSLIYHVTPQRDPLGNHRSSLHRAFQCETVTETTLK